MDAAFRDDGVPTPQYKCTDANVWEQAALAMLPRAVHYAATLVDYFFRGRLDGKLLPPALAGASPRLRIMNPLPSDGRPGERMVGTFEAYYDAADGTRVPVGRWEGRDLKPGAATEVTLAERPMGAPPPVEPGRYLLVFRGQMGNEPEAVAAIWLDGRIWTLTLGATAYEHDWTVIMPPFMTPQTFPAGPTYSRELASVDSAMQSEGGYVVQSSVVHQRSTIYPYTCQGPDYAPVFLGAPFRGDHHRYSAIYRGPAVAWGDQAVLSVTGSGANEDSITPIVIEVVRFVPPGSLEELQSYTYENPPEVEGILYETVASSSQSWVDVGPIALNGATFIGIRVRPLPEYGTSVPETHRGSPLDYTCFQSLLRYGDLPIRSASSGWWRGDRRDRAPDSGQPLILYPEGSLRYSRRPGRGLRTRGRQVVQRVGEEVVRVEHAEPGPLR